MTKVMRSANVGIIAGYRWLRVESDDAQVGNLGEPRPGFTGYLRVSVSNNFVIFSIASHLNDHRGIRPEEFFCGNLALSAKKF